MPKYKKKPVVIEAVRWNGRKIICPPGPIWFVEAEEKNIIQLSGDILYIKIIGGVMRANIGDWIIQGVKGEIYPCKPDIFEATYDLSD